MTRRKTYSGISSLRDTRNELAKQARQERANLRDEKERADQATREADEQERRADSEAKRADSARRDAESYEARAATAKQQLQTTQDVEKIIMQLSNFDTSDDMVEPFDNLKETLIALGTMSKFTDEDRAAFQALEDARNKHPLTDKMRDIIKRNLQRLLEFWKRLEEGYAKVDTGTVDFMRAEQNAIGIER